MRRRRLGGELVAHALDALVAVAEQVIGTLLHPIGDVDIGRAAIGRIILEAAILAADCATA